MTSFSGHLTIPNNNDPLQASFRGCVKLNNKIGIPNSLINDRMERPYDAMGEDSLNTDLYHEIKSPGLLRGLENELNLSNIELKVILDKLSVLYKSIFNYKSGDGEVKDNENIPNPMSQVQRIGLCVSENASLRTAINDLVNKLDESL